MDAVVVMTTMMLLLYRMAMTMRSYPRLYSTTMTMMMMTTMMLTATPNQLLHHKAPPPQQNHHWIVQCKYSSWMCACNRVAERRQCDVDDMEKNLSWHVKCHTTNDIIHTSHITPGSNTSHVTCTCQDLGSTPYAILLRVKIYFEHHTSLTTRYMSHITCISTTRFCQPDTQTCRNKVQQNNAILNPNPMFLNNAKIFQTQTSIRKP